MSKPLKTEDINIMKSFFLLINMRKTLTW